MDLGDKCKKSCRELTLKKGNVEMRIYGKKRFSNIHVFETIFFFERQSRLLIKQIIFQKHCFNDTTHHNNLHILYQEATKFNMYEMISLT